MELPPIVCYTRRQVSAHPRFGFFVSMNASREISVPELARRLHCSMPRAESLIRSGRIRGRNTARGWITTAAAVECYQMQGATALYRPSSKSP